MVVWPLRQKNEQNFVKNDMQEKENMGENMRLYLMPDGTILGFYREQGGVVMFARIPKTHEVVFAYANPEDDNRYELLAATREPKSIHGNADTISLMDRRTGSVKNVRATFLGYAFQSGQNRYKLARTDNVNIFKE